MGTEQLTVSIESRNGVANVALSGELDLATVPILKEHLAHLEREDVIAIVIDLRDLAFLDCSGLRAFLAGRDHARANGHRFVMVGAGSSTRRLLALTGTEYLIDDDETADMLARFTGGHPHGVDHTPSSDADADV